ncbi:MAG: UDP-N-acetylglucosamine 2-epimerase (non-hydrolyzing) [Defluviitaleaceae bacterium]|nr:UDP-N-acetylglucosamine 2-epimerase (non-hydrolyzing) [Defluviitaleaceae bacterium]MCL2262332.1 UDP-N-acetylglucosamine 2-epimerase (non-hydrolyzing) [Defluviitaleaceae bacterium]
MAKKIKVMSVFGTRPEAAKMIPLLLEMRENPQIESIVCVTAQHRELLDGVLQPFGITPDFDLNLMKAGQTLTDITARVLRELAPVLEQTQPQILLVHGDTTTTFAASLAAFYARVAVGHVEAGLRSFDKFRPYPEEINRKITTAIADFHFAPTELSRENLLKENVPPESIFITGNTAIDMIKHTVSENAAFNDSALVGVDFTKRIILMTAHRRENWGQPLKEICNAVKQILTDFPDTFLVWPVHPGKAVIEPAHEILGNTPRALLTKPLDIFDMHNMMKHAHLLLTDSGGLQEESPTFNLPTIVLREVTERPEGLTAGTLTLAGVAQQSVYTETARLLTNSTDYEKMAQAKNPFGDGKASGMIVSTIIENLGGN